MSAGFVCVECSLPVESLFVEYSEKNFRLTRCSHCNRVADKYIEFELLLVLIDIVLHRKPAYRHLLFNRYHPLVGEVSTMEVEPFTWPLFYRANRWVPITVVVIGMVLKLAVLRKTIYRHLYLSSWLHASITTSVEIFLFTSFLLLWASYVYGFQPIETQYVKSFNRLSLAILFPEVFRMVALVLHMFDAEQELLVLLSLLILSIQCNAYCTITNLRWVSLWPGVAGAVLLRYIWQHLIFRKDELWLLGGFT